MTCDVLVLAAFLPEVAPMHAALGNNRPTEFAGLRVAAEAVGIGIAAAAVGAAMRLAEHRPRLAVLVGTCGAYQGAGLVIGQSVVGRRIRLVEPCSLEALGGLSQLPDQMSLSADAFVGAADALEQAGALRADVATTLGVTVDDGAAAQIARATGAQVEHMEAYGVATACEVLDVPFATVLGVSNVVGSKGREHWRENHRQAARAATETVLHWMKEGARGLPPQRPA